MVIQQLQDSFLKDDLHRFIIHIVLWLSNRLNHSHYALRLLMPTVSDLQ